MGQLTWEDWKKNARWSRYDAPNYNPSSVFTQRIEEDMSTGEISFLLFAGSWCEDSQTELPRLFKLLEASNVPSSKVQIHGVDENKHDLAGLSQKYGIYKVPTLIALKNGRELGRIIEHPRTSWELDVIVIIER
jgi:thiol-disulfide isomerase/thioredoxin